MDVIKTEQEFKEQAARSSSLVVVHFLAEWAPQCSQVTDALIELKNDPQCAKANVQFIQVIF